MNNLNLNQNSNATANTPKNETRNSRHKIFNHTRNAATMKHAEKSALKIASRDKSTRDLQIKMNYHSTTSRSIARSLPGINIDHGGTSLATPGLRDSKLEIRVSIFLVHSKACAIEASTNPPCYTGKEGRRREREKEKKIVFEIRIGNDKSRGTKWTWREKFEK